MFKKILTAVRGGVNELGESVVDSQANRIFEQEIRDAENELRQARQELAALMAENTSLGRQIKGFEDEISRREAEAHKALQANQEDLAREVAERIVEAERQRSDLTATRANLQGKVDAMRERMQRSEKQLAEYKRELQVVKTNERVLRTTAQIDTNIGSNQSSLSSAKATLERIRERQQRIEDQQSASVQLEKELTGADLDERLKAAGINQESDAVESVMARLKASRNQPGA
ncbi:MAG: PspA/IM30 family protein [Halomonadaceae bacterium]|uniref:PspA/IM30 family protein n=1 Tax=Halomonas sp. MCCC 1A11062 TaxID=2733485 RepID=UPI001F3D1159|nr:PspA/IM30 family protein [Halomonas sp. MCCC 1A11062]